MIVDVHTHTPSHRAAVPEDEVVLNSAWRPDRVVTATTSWADHAAAAREANVDVSIAFNIAVPSSLETTGLPSDASRVNDATAEFVRDDPARRIGFLSVNPEAPGALQEVERSVGDLGLRGVKLGPNYQGFDPLGASAMALYAELDHRTLPVLFHTGTSPIAGAPLRHAQPLVFDEVAIRFPELRIVLAHLGHPWQADAIAVIRKHRHVYADVSAGFYRPWSFYSAMRLATEWDVLHKLLFGSDFPVTRPAEVIAGLRAVASFGSGLLPAVPEAAIEAIIERDALGLLGLDRPGPTATLR